LREILAEREGFIALPEVHEIKRLSNIPEYPYLRKYLARKGQSCSSPYALLQLQYIVFTIGEL
jgi:hypothetical protein